VAVASTTSNVMVSGVATSTRAVVGKHTFNCVSDLAHWETAWDEPKRRWCCDHFRWGCHGSSSDSAVTTVAATSINTDSVAIPTTDTRVSSGTYDCWAGVSNYKVVWSAAKRHWCCLKEHLACDDASTGATEAHNCSEGRATCITSWSLAKKSWCLQVVGQGCLLTTAPPLILPQAKAETFKGGSIVTQPAGVETIALLISLVALVGFLAVCRLRSTTQPNAGMHTDYMLCNLRQGILCIDSESANHPRQAELAGNSHIGNGSGQK